MTDEKKLKFDFVRMKPLPKNKYNIELYTASVVIEGLRVEAFIRHRLPGYDGKGEPIRSYCRAWVRVAGKEFGLTQARTFYEEYGGFKAAVEAANDIARKFGQILSGAKLRTALEKINEIRNSIVGFQTISWSEHVYPLVAALEEAGFEGLPYRETRGKAVSLIDQVKSAEERIEQLTKAIEELPPYVGDSQEVVSHVERCRLAAGVLRGAKIRERKLIELVKEGVRLASHEEDGYAVNHNRHNDECTAFIAKAKELLG